MFGWFKKNKVIKEVEDKEKEHSRYCGFCRYVCKKYGPNSAMYRAAIRKKKLIEADIEGAKVRRRLAMNGENIAANPYRYGIRE